MQKNTGVSISAVCTILGSALLVVFAAVFVFGMVAQPPAPGAPPNIKIVFAVMCSVLLAFAAWGFATGVGLFRRRPWSRLSILIFSGLLAFGCGSGALFAAIMTIPPTPNTNPGTMAGIKMGIAGFYGSLGLLGAFWLWFFNTAAVKADFDGGLLPPGRRPLSISVIGVLMIFGGALSLVTAVLPFPAVFFFWVLNGLAAHAVFAMNAGLYLWAGYGLLKLRVGSRVLAICTLVYSVLSIAAFSLLPGFADRTRTMMETMPAALRTASTPSYASSTYAGLLVGALASAIQIWFLVRNGAAFQRDRGLGISE